MLPSPWHCLRQVGHSSAVRPPSSRERMTQQRPTDGSGRRCSSGDLKITRVKTHLTRVKTSSFRFSRRNSWALGSPCCMHSDVRGPRSERFFNALKLEAEKLRTTPPVSTWAVIRLFEQGSKQRKSTREGFFWGQGVFGGYFWRSFPYKNPRKNQEKPRKTLEIIHPPL